MRGRIGTVIALGLAVAFVGFRVILGAFEPEPEGTVINLWHKYRDQELAALETAIDRYNAAHRPAVFVRLREVPQGAFQDSLIRNIEFDQGPDVFIFEHNPLGRLVRQNLVAPIAATHYTDAGYLPGLLDGLTVDGQVYGLPVNYKGLFVYRNTKLAPNPITREADLAALRQSLPAEVFPLAYPPTDFFFHAPLFTAYGGQVFDADGNFVVFSGAGGKSFAKPAEWEQAGILGRDLNYDKALKLFNDGKAAAWISGPWAVGAVTLPAESWTVDELFAVNGQPMGSMVTVEAAMIPTSTKHPAEALELARYLASREAAEIRLEVAGLAPIFADRYVPDADTPALPAVCAVQRAALENGFVTPNKPRMDLVWTAAKQTLENVMRGTSLQVALDDASRDLAVRDQPPPPPAPATPYLVFASLLMLLAVGWLVMWVANREHRVQVKAGRTAYQFLLPGMLAVLVLTVAPLVVGALLSLFAFRPQGWDFVGIQNFTRIVASQEYPIWHPRNFFFTLGVTVLWTVVNVALHVGIGVGIALMLRHQWMKTKAVYRVLLILPWAIPNYITALMWKGMFDTQHGAINGILVALGAMDAGEPLKWFDHFATAFTANLCTNTWLGFPFMMVVTLGALQNVPSELEEAATLDGASRWHKFRFIVWPHLKPALLPAVILGSVWTFNMFNVIYLVSGGQPNGETEILVTEAYRWAFEGDMRQGYAAAYATLIFFILLGYTGFTNWLMKPRKPREAAPSKAFAKPIATETASTGFGRA